MQIRSYDFDKNETKFTNFLSDKFDKYKINKYFISKFNELQEVSSCCGITDYKDYWQTDWKTERQKKKLIYKKYDEEYPLSCCGLTNEYGRSCTRRNRRFQINGCAGTYFRIYKAIQHCILAMICCLLAESTFIFSFKICRRQLKNWAEELSD
ncbi:uncharacterized protein LOC123295851 [Chrysoperla carnea]|uniref:uncharacterized protein LOC123295851 n=1 Tax=Chrysoperla carnea TaxID=189513 RepID=UPI001D074688|nr:uncharacterized protein LOC123295851 [Chrysoperla carnea]